MKILFSLILCTTLLVGCSNTSATPPAGTVPASAIPTENTSVPDSSSRVSRITEITLSDSGITVDGGMETDTVFTSHDIIYYENRDTYESGNPYGEGSDADKHTADEAAAHTVVNITAPGAYRITGKLSAGQIRVDLGKDAYDDPNAVVDLILQDTDITCTVAPAILFLNTYECDGNWSEETAKADVDTSAAGANLILEGNSTVNGSYVAKIFKDKDGEKKLWKQDGAIYSYMSMNVYGPGSLELNAANEGMDTELHLTVNSGSIVINSGNDGINTNEDGVSVTTVNGGNLTIHAGLGAEGDGIDSNGYLVINGGTVISCAKPVSDSGLDSALGSFIHGGSVIAMGSAMDWTESDSGQVTMNLQFAAQQKAGSKITVTREDGTEVFSFEDDGPNFREFSGLILSHAVFTQGETYHIYVDDVQMAYAGTDVRRGPGGMPPMDFDPSNLPEDFEKIPTEFDPENIPEGFRPGQMPDGFDPSKMGSRGPYPDGNDMTPPEGFDGKFPEGGFGGRGQAPVPAGDPSTEFYMNDPVNFFSGVAAAT